MKRDRSPSPNPPVLEQEWVDEVEEVIINDLAHIQAEESASGQSGREDAQVLSASQSQKLLIRSLT